MSLVKLYPDDFSKDDMRDVILGAWILWKHRNACAFDESAPNLQSALQAFKDELNLWHVVGAKDLAELSVGRGLQ
jgi:hypothetical protein